MEERRRVRRLDLTGSIIIKALGDDTGGEEEAQITVTDCSRFGIGFLCDKQLMIGDIYEASLTIWTKETLVVFLQIVRSEKLEEGYKYGCIFIGMPDTDRKRIEVYETVEMLIPQNE